MNISNYQIMTLDAKSLFKYFPNKNGEENTGFCFDTRKRTLYTLVVKEENELEECPMLHQLLEVLKEELGDKFDETNEYLLLDQFLIMDFDNIFMPIDEKATDASRKYREGLQANVKDLMENGLKLQFDNHEVHMMPFDKSGNMSRNGRISFVNKEYAARLNERLNLGMDFSKIEVKLSKYYAYRGLYLSTSQRVNHEKFEITPETLIIINDTREASGESYENEVSVLSAKEGATKKDWNFQEPIEYKRLYVKTPYDGQGLITPEYSEYINKALGIDGANSFQIRLPFAKGMLHQVDILGFIDEYTKKDVDEEKYLYIDAFGKERDLRKAHILMTESMFKGKAWLETHCKEQGIDDPMEYYCKMIEEYNHGLYVSGTNLPYGHSNYTHLSYQTINTLAFNEGQFKRVIEGHGRFIENPLEFLKNWDEIEHDGIVKEDEDKVYQIPNWKRAVLQNTNFAGDAYVKKQLENTQKSLLSKIALGKILVEGQTRYLCRDLAPLLSSLLRENKDVRGAYLRSLYTRFYMPQGKKNKFKLNFEDYYAFFRNPHLSRNEQFIMRAFVHPKSEADYTKDGRKDYEHYTKYVNMYDKYFGHLTGIVMVPRGSTLPLCLGGADFDGDLVSIISNKDVVDAVAKGVYQYMPSKSLYYYKRKLPAVGIPTTGANESVVPKYVEYEHVYNTFSNHIGRISNAAISIGQVEYDRNTNCEYVFDAKKPTCDKCTILTGLEIDAAKNGVHPNLDLILETDIPKAEYLSFLKSFRELKSEKNFQYKTLEVSMEEKEIDGAMRENGVVEISAKNCKTVVRWDTSLEKKGTYINLLPYYFLKYWKVYNNSKISASKPKVTQKEKLSKEEKDSIKAFQNSCEEILRIHKFYKEFLKSLTKEKNKGYYAVENSEIHIMRMYDEDQVDKKLFETLLGIKEKIAAAISDASQIEDIRARINTEQWQFQPKERRGQVLEQIIGNGFKENELTEEERELLYHFHQQGYRLLWRIMDLIEGPKIRSYEEMFEQECESTKKLLIEEFENLDYNLYQELMHYYENNTANISQAMYTHTLRELKNVIDIYVNTGMDISKLVIALYKKTWSYLDKEKFFWDAFSWKDLECLVEEKEAKETC